MPDYRKKPIVINAEQWFPGLMPGIVLRPGEEGAPTSWFDEKGLLCPFAGDLGWIGTLEGGHVVSPGDYIITGIKGEKYPCKPDIFNLTYAPVKSMKELSSITYTVVTYCSGYLDSKVTWSDEVGGICDIEVSSAVTDRQVHVKVSSIKALEDLNEHLTVLLTTLKEEGRDV